MNQIARHPTLRSLVCCLLTLMASGDDFNLMRVLLPAQFVGVAHGSLPLDDENTDFDAQTLEEETPLRQTDLPNAPAPALGVAESWALWQRRSRHAPGALLARPCTTIRTDRADGSPDPSDFHVALPETPLRC